MSKSKDCFFALIDILGFSDYVKKESCNNVYRFLSAIVEVVDRLNVKVKYKVEVFSDTILLAAPSGITDIAVFVDYINAFQLESIVSENLGILPLRGVITRGEYFSKGKIKFGKALVEADEKQKNEAKNPRIIVNKDSLPPHIYPRYACDVATSLNRRFGGNLKMIPQTQRLHTDLDGFEYCNYLNSLVPYAILDQSWDSSKISKIARHKKFIENKLAAYAEDETVKEKYIWMKKYHNWFCDVDDELVGYRIDDAPHPHNQEESLK
ncbi:MAG: hypothetical protein LBR85_05290 [Oscillospiraceae bacterium]|jgi:hypothetical protein|nr:hypothetical protein [Oscillospiraceae bacterium]